MVAMQKEITKKAVAKRNCKKWLKKVVAKSDWEKAIWKRYCKKSNCKKSLQKVIVKNDYKKAIAKSNCIKWLQKSISEITFKGLLPNCILDSDWILQMIANLWS